MDLVQGQGFNETHFFLQQFPRFHFSSKYTRKETTYDDKRELSFATGEDATSGCLLIPATTDSMPASSPGSHNSSSSHGFTLKRATSDAKLLDLAQEKTKLLVRSNSQNIFINNHATSEAPLMPQNLNNENETVNYTVKASFGEENIRFSLHHQSSFNDLKQEVLSRFDVDNISKVYIKYLDDDPEWALLTCDADLDECLDIHRSTKIRTIKISVVNKCL